MPIVAPSRASTIAFDFTLATARHANSRSRRSVVVGCALRHDASTRCRRSTAGGTLLHEHAAAHALVVERAVPRHARASLEHAQVLLAAEDLERAVAERRRDDALDEQARHRLRRRVVHGHGEGDHRAERRHRIAGERLLVRLERVAPMASPHGVVCLMIAQHGSLAERIDREQRALEVEQVVERELLAALLRERRRARRPGARRRTPPPVRDSRRSAAPARARAGATMRSGNFSSRCAANHAAIAASYAAVCSNTFAGEQATQVEVVVARRRARRARARSPPDRRPSSPTAKFFAAERSMLGPPMSICSMTSSGVTPGARRRLRGTDRGSPRRDRSARCRAPRSPPCARAGRAARAGRRAPRGAASSRGRRASRGTA